MSHGYGKNMVFVCVCSILAFLVFFSDSFCGWFSFEDHFHWQPYKQAPTHNQTATRLHTPPLYPLSIPHSFFPPKHSLSFRRFQIDMLNGFLSLLSSYRNWCYTSNKVYHDFITVSLYVFKKTASSKLNFQMILKSFCLLFAIALFSPHLYLAFYPSPSLI